MRGAVDLTERYRELGVRNIRLHDVPWTFDNVQDINFVFPHFDADPDDPASYDFAQTDYYLSTIVPLGANIVFRLGYSAEWDRTPPRHNAPPKSTDQFARICAGIVKHYTQGWAGGADYNISHWEIWNEPDIPMFWTGTPEQSYELFAQTALAIKAIDPALKVGGPGLCDVFNHREFLDGLLRHCTERGVGLDFVTWHMYDRDPCHTATAAHIVRSSMDRFGYGSAQSILDEWNMGPQDWEVMKASPEAMQAYFDEIHGNAGAAYIASVLVRLQDSPVDVATFFSGTNMIWGLFNVYGVPHKASYAFVAFSKLLATPNRMYAEITDQEIDILAGINSDKNLIQILLSNYSRSTKPVQIPTPGIWPSFSYDALLIRKETAGLERPRVIDPTRIDLPPMSVCLLEFEDGDLQ